MLLIHHKACSEFICEHICIWSIFEKCLSISNTDFWVLALRIWWEHRVPSPWTLSTCVYNMVLQTGKKLKGPFKGLWVPQKAVFFSSVLLGGVSISSSGYSSIWSAWQHSVVSLTLWLVPGFPTEDFQCPKYWTLYNNYPLSVIQQDNLCRDYQPCLPSIIVHGFIHRYMRAHTETERYKHADFICFYYKT